MKKLLKQYYRKNPTSELQAKTPLEEFVPSTSIFQTVRDTIANIAKTANMIIHSTKNPEGNISAQHYMTIIQKLSTVVYKALLLYMFGVNNQNYDWKEDPSFLKAKSTQAEALKQIVKPVGTTGMNYLINFLRDTNRDNFLWGDTLQAIVKGINTKEGTNVLTIAFEVGPYTNIETGEQFNARHFNIKDLSVINEEAIKQARKQRGMNREGLNQRTKAIRLPVNIPNKSRRKPEVPGWGQQSRTSWGDNPEEYDNQPTKRGRMDKEDEGPPTSFL
jgi:hypothetical protein